MCQFVFKKGIKSSFVDLFRKKCEESGSRYIFINQEYDGSERYALLFPSGFSIDFFPQDDNLIFLSWIFLPLSPIIFFVKIVCLVLFVQAYVFY